MVNNFNLDPVILREYDIRGIVETQLTPDAVRAIGQGFGTMAYERGCRTVAVAYDGRLSSTVLETALVEGLSSTGLDVTRIGLGPTPMLYFATYHLGVDAGLMITGSHNPPEYNGIKMVCQGKSFWGPDIRELGDRVRAGTLRGGEGIEPGTVTEQSIFDDYIDRMASDYRGDKELKVAWDPGNGSSGDAIVALTNQLPGTHFLINEEIDGTFPNHHPDPTVEENLQQLKDLVKAEGCDLGFAFDGDGDRIGLVDSQGRVLWGDQILIVLAREVLQDHPGATIIADVKASRAFFEEIEAMGGKPLMWKTGHSLIKNKMHETGAPLAGEMSAHIFIKHRYYGYDDAAYAAVRVLSILASGHESIDQIRDSLPDYINTPELRFPCSEDRKLPVVAEVKERLSQIDGITVYDIDGVRVENEDGWWLLRSSNTQDVLVARCESKSHAGLARLQAELATQLKQSGIFIPD